MSGLTHEFKVEEDYVQFPIATKPQATIRAMYAIMEKHSTGYFMNNPHGAKVWSSFSKGSEQLNRFPNATSVCHHREHQVAAIASEQAHDRILAQKLRLKLNVGTSAPTML